MNLQPHSLLVILLIMLITGCSADKKQRVVFFGDSITQAGEEDPAGYLNVMRDQLDTAKYEIIGAGISGNKVTDLQGRVQEDVIAQLPNIVFIYIGINDVWHFYEFEGTTGTEIGAYEAGLIDLVGMLQTDTTDVILCTPSVIGEKPAMEGEINQQLDAYTEVVRKVASETSCGICDLRTAFKEYLSENNPVDQEEGILTTDGVHMNPAGDQFLADKMLECLQRYAGN
jgi:isoamyl acetate esterase